MASDPKKHKDAIAITFDTTREYQEIDGFGFTLTGGSALHLHKLNNQARHAGPVRIRSG